MSVNNYSNYYKQKGLGQNIAAVMLGFLKHYKIYGIYEIVDAVHFACRYFCCKNKMY